MTDGHPGAGEVVVRYWAAAREAAGCASEKLAAGSLEDVIAAASERHPGELARLLTICSFIVGDLPVKKGAAANVALEPGSVVEVLPPFAGGSGLMRAEP